MILSLLHSNYYIVYLLLDSMKQIQLPTNQSMKTLVMLQEQSHQDFMYGEIKDFEHQEIYKSWENIRASLDNEIALQDESPIEVGNGEVVHVYEDEN